MKRMMRLACVVVCGLGMLSIGSPGAEAGDPPALLAEGAYRCQVSREYKFRACTVRKDGRVTTLALEDAGHLLTLQGPVFGPHLSKEKVLFFEASLTGEKPYVCGVADEAARQECKAQKLMIRLERRGEAWVGTFPIKQYWDRWEGAGDARKVVGHDVDVTMISFTLKK